ncbi:toll/interleukin-1 receptor domain-containing protein [Actinocrispum sp. NPDC049592]|uniref:toll/interleukin-1 receptor domain-containing protein n=1 Tax=Actinocrispum sp. NPDC049592 TaxID=3154835 RepID=UPI00342AEAE1
MGEEHMGGVFINYRTGDGDWAATFVSRELAAKFGPANVFFASKSIRVGEDFVTRILDRLRQCEVFLAVIGSRWLTATDRQGNRRLDNSDDWVRREIAEAFKAGLRVIPVFLDGTPPLTEADLPAEIGMLARCQYLRLHHRNDDRDIERVLDELTELLSSAEVMPRGKPDDIVAQLKKALTESNSKVADMVHTATVKALDALGESRYPVTVRFPDREMPGKLAERLVSYERDMTELLRLVANGIAHGDSGHDELWVRVVERLLNRVRRRISGPWISAEAYPALLLSYAAGIASTATGREDIAYQVLMSAKTGDTPAIRSLGLRHVVDPRYAAEFPEWNGVRYYHPLSRHLRKSLRPIFADLLDEHEYEYAFEEYEYLRSLLELHDSAFASLGEFAYSLANGHSGVHVRMNTRLADGSPLLKAGAFDGDPTHVTAARHQLEASIRGRYR